jgi:tetratricopeptide (TPR) repeat protein/transposase-like protein
VPADICQLIRRRIERLPRPARELLELAAVVVSPIEPELLRRAWERLPSGHDLDEALRRLTQARLLQAGDRAYAFCHDLIREVVYEGLEPNWRRNYHRAIAEALEAQASVRADPSSWGALAHHFARGGRPRKALGYVLRALRWAEQRRHSSQGLALSELGLELCQKLELEEQRRLTTRRRARLLAWSAFFHNDLGDHAAEERMLGQLLQLVRNLGGRWKLLALRRWVALLFASDRYQELKEVLEEGLRLARASGERAYEAFFRADLGRLYWTWGEGRRAEAELLRAYRYLRSVRRPWELRQALRVLCNLGNLAYDRGAYERALSRFDEARRLNERLGDPSWAANIGVRRSNVLYLLGRYGEARAHLEEGRKSYRELGHRPWEARATILLGLVLGKMGELAQAERLLQEGLRLAVGVGDRMAEGLGESRLGSVYLRQGRVERALEHLERGAKIIEEIGDRVHEPEVWAALAEGYLQGAHGRAPLLKRAEEHSRRAMELLEAGGGWCETAVLHTHWQVLQAQGASKAKEAALCLERAYERVQEIAGGLRTPGFRESFLNVPLHRELIAAYEGHPSAVAGAGEEEHCYERLREARWGTPGPEGSLRPICPYCGGERVHGHGRLPNRPERRYLCQECGGTFSDRTGTVFSHRNLPLSKLFQALKLISQTDPPLGARELAGILKVDLKTGADLRKRLREALQEEPWVGELARRL